MMSETPLNQMQAIHLLEHAIHVQQVQQEVQMLPNAFALLDNHMTPLRNHVFAMMQPKHHDLIQAIRLLVLATHALQVHQEVQLT